MKDPFENEERATKYIEHLPEEVYGEVNLVYPRGNYK